MSEEQVQFPSLTRLRDKAIERKEQALMEEEKNKAEGNTSKRRSLVLDTLSNKSALGSPNKSPEGLTITPSTGYNAAVVQKGGSPGVDSPILSKLPASPSSSHDHEYSSKKSSLGQYELGSPPGVDAPTDDQGLSPNVDVSQDDLDGLDDIQRTSTLTHLTSKRPRLNKRQQPTKNPVRELAKVQNDHLAATGKASSASTDDDKNEEQKANVTNAKGFKLPGIPMGGFGLRKANASVGGKEEVQTKDDDTKPKLKPTSSESSQKPEDTAASTVDFKVKLRTTNPAPSSEKSSTAPEPVFASVQLKSASRASQQPEIKSNDTTQSEPVFKGLQLRSVGRPDVAKEEPAKSPVKEEAPKFGLPSKLKSDQDGVKPTSKEPAPKSPVSDETPKSPVKEEASKFGLASKVTESKDTARSETPKSPVKEEAPKFGLPSKIVTNDSGPKSPLKVSEPSSPVKQDSAKDVEKNIVTKTSISKEPSPVSPSGLTSKLAMFEKKTEDKQKESEPVKSPGVQSSIKDRMSAFDNAASSKTADKKSTGSPYSFSLKPVARAEERPVLSKPGSFKNENSGAVPEFQQMRNKLRSMKSSKDNLSVGSASDKSAKDEPNMPEFVGARKSLKDVNQSTSNTNLNSVLAKKTSDGSLRGSRSSISTSTSNLSPRTQNPSSTNLARMDNQNNDVQSDFSALKSRLKPSGNASWNDKTHSDNSTTRPQYGFTSTNATLRSQPQNTPSKTETSFKIKTVDTNAILVKSEQEKAEKFQNLESNLSKQTTSTAANAFNTQLKTVKNDQFVNKAGGAVRPKETLLWNLKGKRRAVVRKVPVSFASLNLTDAYIMDIPPVDNGAPAQKDGFVDPEDKQPFRNLYVFTGEKTPKVRRSRAIEIANMMKDLDYSGKAEIVLIDIDNPKSKVILEKELLFWNQILGKTSTRSEISDKLAAVPIQDAQSDAEYDKELDESINLKEFPSNKTIASASKDLKRALMNTTSCCVLDAKTEVYVWAGKNSSDSTRESAMSYAQNLSKTRNIELFLEGEKFERIAFRLKFEDWPLGKEMSVYNVLEVKQAGNIKAKDKEWKVYDRGSDTKKVDKVDIPKMYDKRTSPEVSITKNTEALDIDPAELINRDWGFGALRCWVVYNEASGATEKGNTKIVSIGPDALAKLERKISPSEPLVFYSKECYIFMYEYKERPPNMADAVLAERLKITKEELFNQMKDNALLYLWSGSESSVSDQGIMAHTALEVEKHIKPLRAAPNAKPRHIRVQENKEPLHFLNVVNGGNVPPDQPKKIYDMLPQNDNPPSVGHIVRKGSKEAFSSAKTALYHISGVTKETTHVAQLSSLDATLVSSAHSYVLLQDKNIMVWKGTGSFKWEQEMASKFAKEILAKETGSRSIEEFNENSEPQKFWSALKGSPLNRSSESFWKTRPNLKVTFDSKFTLASSQSADSSAPYDVRLWKINYFLNGNPTATEFSPFNTTDLDEEGVFILDAYFAIFVWVGCNVGRNKLKAIQGEPEMLKKVPEEKVAGKGPASSFKEMVLAIETAQRYADYINERENQRISRNDVYVLQSGKETPLFKNQFPAWEERSSGEDDGWPSNIQVDKAAYLIDGIKYPLDKLKTYATERQNLPFGLDLEKLEKYLSQEDFQKVFKMDAKVFNEMPQWKQIDTKKRVGLF